MVSKKARQIRYGLAAVLAASLSLTVQAGQGPVKRGEPQPRGRGWEERLECSAPAREGGRLVVRADLGSLSVKPGANDRLECQVLLRVHTSDESEARRILKNYALSVRTVEGTTFLDGRFLHEHYRHARLGAEFLISMPLRFNLDLETKGGAIEVEKLDGPLKAVTAGGGIRAGDVSGPVQAVTAGGNIALGNVGAALEARTAGGSIRTGDVKGAAMLETSGGEIVAGLVSGVVIAGTAGGDIVLRGASGAIEAETAGGQIQIGESGGAVIAKTAGGSIQMLGAKGKMEVKTEGGSINLFQVRSPVIASTAAGPILAQMDPQWKTFSAWDLQTAVGDVKVYIPPELALTIDAVIDHAAGHELISDFPIQIEGDREGFVQRTLRGRGALNGGGELLRIRTIVGNIEIRKLDPQALGEFEEQKESFWKRWKDKELRHKHHQRD